METVMNQGQGFYASALPARAVGALLTFSFALGACVPPIQDYSWSPYPIAENRITTNETLAAGGTVVIVNENPDAERRMIIRLGRYEFYTSLKYLGDAVVTQLADELRKRRFTIDGAAPKYLRIKITRPSVTPGIWARRAHFTLEVVAGNGYRLARPINNTTAGSDHRAFDGAVALAVIATLNDPKIVEYLTGPG